MTIFWYEFLFFVTAMFGVLVAYSSASLFYQTLRAERDANTAWRAIGFILILVALVLFILERKFGFFGFAGIIIEALGFFAIYRGVLAQPRLSHLTQVKKRDPAEIEQLSSYVISELRSRILSAYQRVLAELKPSRLAKTARVPFNLAVGFLILFTLGTIVQLGTSFLASLIVLVSLIFILLTIRLQIRRYKNENKDLQTRHNNLYPLIGYVFFAIRAVALMGFRLPDIDLVWTRSLNALYGIPWVIAAITTAIGFLFLAFWAWRFIRVRFLLRTYVVFLALTISVAIGGVLIFSLLIFQVVERNNLDLMARGARTEALIMTERKNVAEMLARLLAEDPVVTQAAVEFAPGVVSRRAEFFREQTNVDIIRFFNPEGEVLASPTDARDIGRSFSRDATLRETIEQGVPTSTFDVIPGVLSEVVVGRALHPVIGLENEVTGVVEVAYVFDNAFVDFSKRETELDVTIYSGRERSASTILTGDGTSRWVGSNETEQDVLAAVLRDGGDHQTALDRLGIPYYSAFLPIRNEGGSIIGMVSVGVPTNILLEETRQRFLSSFFMATLISFLSAIAGYFAFRNFNDASES